MALETTVYDLADYLWDPAEIAGYLAVELEEDEPKFMVLGLEAVIRARGSVETVAEETGVSAECLKNLAELDDAGVRETANQVMEAYRAHAEVSSRVA